MATSSLDPVLVGNPRPLLALWTAVLHRALLDYRAGGKEREKVAWWLTTRDFLAVCELAGFEPDGVRRAFSVGRVPQD
ncbi:hypothetical protein JCM19379_22750 [Methyloparacoccus murrellii]